MKLFTITYLQDDDDGGYLTVGEDFDTETSIRTRELNKEKWEDTSCLYYFTVTEVTEIDGHKIIVV